MDNMKNFENKMKIVMVVGVSLWALSISAVIYSIVIVWPYIRDVLIKLAS